MDEQTDFEKDRQKGLFKHLVSVGVKHHRGRKMPRGAIFKQV